MISDLIPNYKRKFYIIDCITNKICLNLDLTKVFCVQEGNQIFVKGFEGTLMLRKYFNNKFDAHDFEKNWWLNLNTIIEYNNNFLLKLYGNNLSRFKSTMTVLTCNLKTFYTENKDIGYVI